jgi:uncharacterized membrane protein
MALWANLHLVFWLSLVPFVTKWMGQTDFATWPVVIYGALLFACAAAWDIVRRVLLRHHDPESALARAVGVNPVKEWASLALYVVAIGAAFVSTWVACALYFVVAALWFIPDRRIERAMRAGQD